MKNNSKTDNFWVRVNMIILNVYSRCRCSVCSSFSFLFCVNAVLNSFYSHKIVRNKLRIDDVAEQRKKSIEKAAAALVAAAAHMHTPFCFSFYIFRRAFFVKDRGFLLTKQLFFSAKLHILAFFWLFITIDTRLITAKNGGEDNNINKRSGHQWRSPIIIDCMRLIRVSISSSH